MSGRQKRKKSTSSSTDHGKRRPPSVKQKPMNTPPTNECIRSRSTGQRGSKNTMKKVAVSADVHTANSRSSRLETIIAPPEKGKSVIISKTNFATSGQGGNSSTSSSRRDGEMSTKSRIIEKSKKKKSQVATFKNEHNAHKTTFSQQKKIAIDGDINTPPIGESRSNTDLAPSIHNHMSSILHAFALQCNRLSLEELNDQYNKLPDANKEECKEYLDAKNQLKNRYGNIYCLDKSRIHLTFLKEEGSYIHANKIQYESLKNPFIITQGPLSRTVNDFWRMIWQERVENIVMLCNNMENGRHKSKEYFCQMAGERASYGRISVKTCLRDWEAGLGKSRLEITYNGQTRTVMHYHMSEWRDCRAPVVCVRQMFELLKIIRQANNPSVVHCSAGVGRSGTFVAVEMCLMDVAHGREVDVQQVVTSLRRFRCHAVQTFEQYLAIHKYVLQFGQQNDCVRADEIADFTRLFNDYSSSLA